MADFPFFKDSMKDFPGLGGLDGQSYRDTFDYSRYNVPANLYLLSVPWRSDYQDVVAFSSESERDSWLSSSERERVDYSTPWLRVPRQRVNVPLPYERAMRYNYLYLDIPRLPVDDSDAPTRLFYFIVDIDYAAPSTTALTLELDVWQTYAYRIDVESLMLERGHAPMRRITVDGYLSNPARNNGYLLAPDINLDANPARISHVETYPIGSGTKYLVLALPIAASDIADIVSGSSATSSAPSYYDIDARNGYQLGVSGYQWAHDGYAYTGAAMDITPGLSSDGRTLDGSTLYAIAYPGARAALAALAASAPYVLATASYIAILPAAMISSTSSVTLAGYTWNVIDANPRVELEPFELTRDNIDLPDYAADYAKLYTSPYTRLLVQDFEGNGFEIRIEDIDGNALEFNADISLASASLIFDIEGVNIGTASETSITWQTLDGSQTSVLFGSDIAKHMLSWDIPTYDVKLSAGTLEAARTWRDLEAKRQAALNSYKQAVRGANTALANTQAANATAVANTANSGRTSQANQVLENTRDNTITAQNVSTNNDMSVLSHDQAYNISAADDEFQQGAVDVGTWGAALAGVNNAVGSLATGNVLGAVSTGFGAALSISTNAAMADLSLDALLAKQGATVDYIDRTAAVQNTNTTNNNTTSVTTATNINNNNVNLANANATSSANTSNNNALQSRGDSVTAAKENLEQAQRAAQNVLASRALDVARISSAAGDNTLDALNKRAFAVKVLTQSDYALRATAAHFERYGYALNAPLDFHTWLELGDWCYWQGKRAIIRGGIPDLYKLAFERMFENGFTAWISPEKVGNYA